MIKQSVKPSTKQSSTGDQKGRQPKMKTVVTYAKKPVKPAALVLNPAIMDDSPNITPEEKAKIQREAAARKAAAAAKAPKPVQASKKAPSKPVEAPKAPAKPVEAPKAPAKAPTPPVGPKRPTPLTKELLAAGFTYVRTEKNADGYTHPDNRAALHIRQAGGDRWQIKYANGSMDEGSSAKELHAVLELNSKKAEAPKAPEPDRATPKVVEVAPTLPANVVSAVAALGGYTLQRYTLHALSGESKVGQRCKLMALLTKREKVAAKDATMDKLGAAFFSALAVSPADFIVRCKQINQAHMKVKAAEKKVQKAAEAAEQEYIKKAMRATVMERTVPGTILPTHKKLSKKAQARLDAATAKEVFELAQLKASEPIYAPKPDATVVVIPSELRLLEDPTNGIVLFQLERENSQGAICVYNNGSRVAAGVVAPEVLRQLRTVANADLLQAASQLLSPVVPGTEVTPVAQRHLTAVLHCKEIIPMANENKKFASPKSTAPSAKKAAAQPTKAEVKAAEKAAKADAKAAKSAKAEKPAKAAKAPKAESNGAGRVGQFTDNQKIVLLQKENPRREGTEAHKFFELYRTCKTVGAYLAAGGDRGYMNNDFTKRGLIKIV